MEDERCHECGILTKGHLDRYILIHEGKQLLFCDHACLGAYVSPERWGFKLCDDCRKGMLGE